MRLRIVGVFAVFAMLFATLLGTSPAQAKTSLVVTQPTKVFYIGEENMSRTKAFANMPYLKSLAATYGEATHVTNPLDPSLPNYLKIAFNNDFGITDDGNPKHHPNLHGQTIYGAAVANGKTAHVYAQDMSGGNCQLFDQTYYKVRHAGGLPYATDERALCNQILTSSVNMISDANAGSLSNVTWYATSVRDDAHKPSTPKIADDHLKVVIPQIMATQDYKDGNVVIVVSTDEGSGSGAGSSIVPFVVIHPSISHVSVSTALTETDLYHAFIRYGGGPVSAGDSLAGFGL